MFKLNIYNSSTHHLADLLPWVCLIAPGIIFNKDGSLQRSCRFRGPDMESASNELLQSAMAKLNNVLKRLGSGWAFYIEARRETVIYEMPEKHFPDSISLLMDIEHHKRFANNHINYESYYYLTWQYLPDANMEFNIGPSLSKGYSNLHAQDKESLAYFNEQTHLLFNLLKELCFEAELLSDEETLTYLHAAVSVHKHSIKMPKVPIYLDALLADTPLLGGLKPKLGELFIKTVTIIGFPATSVPAILDRLNYLSFNYRWMTRFIALDKLEAEKQLKRQRQKWFSKRKNLINLLQEVLTKQESSLQDSAAIEKAKEVDEALNLLGGDSVSYGYYTCTIVVLDEQIEIANQKQKEIERIIQSLGFTCIAETVNAVEAWLSSIPGHAYSNVRKPLLHTLNLVHLIPYSSTWSGQKYDKHLNAAPLFYAYTYGNTPFSFVLHHGDVGHHMIFGPTGGGKSVLLNFMACQFRRYSNSKVFIFDKGKSFLALTKAIGGNFYELGDHGLKFQPLANIDNENEMQWAAQWLFSLVELSNNKITPDMKQEIWQALQGLMGMPKEHRTLSGLTFLLQHELLRKILMEYTIQGSFGEILDADDDNMADGSWTCFEMEELMTHPNKIIPILLYLFHQLEKNFLGEPVLLILDEAWLFLDHTIFVNKIKDWLKSLRKKNVSIIFATQSISDAANNSIAATLLESCPGRIFLPNDRAKEPQIMADYIKLGLNDQQVELLCQAQAKKHYYYQSSLGNCLFSLELGQVALALCASNKQEDINFIQKYHDSNQATFLNAFFEYKNIPWMLDILQEVYGYE